MKSPNRISRTTCWLLGLLLSGTVACAQAEAPKPGGKNQTPPKPLKMERPVYPLNLQRLGLRGSVTLDFVIDHEGNVRNPVVFQSNNPWFERPAMDAILQWKFTPAVVDGKKVNTRTRQEVIFDLWGRGETPWILANKKAKKTLPPEMLWDVAPEPINTAYPVYPFEALQAGVKGKTAIIYLIDTSGEVAEARLLEATTPEMGLAVLAMIDTWRFKPARKKDGTKVATLMGMEHEFLPHSSGDVPVGDDARAILRDLEKRPESIRTPGDLDQPPKPVSRRPPVYPSALLKDGRPGEAMIEFIIDRNGDAQLPRVVSSSAPEFGYAAAQAVATWRFEVPKKDGKPVVVRVRIPVNFTLKERKPAGEK